MRTRTAAGILATTAIFAMFVYQRRWISDDGLIVVRTVRQLLAGNGPTFNVFERAEANTSTLWTYILALVIGVTHGDPTITTVVTGGVLAIAGVAIAMDGTRRWHRARGSDATLVPAGILIVLAVFPFWDYATSGLETGLTMFWIGVAWWLFSVGNRPFVIATVLGLGPLVRPELALVSAVFSIVWWCLHRPSRRRTLALIGVAFIVPLAYEIFRAGYYGTLLPLPALAKGASTARWARGLRYVWDYANPCRVYVPVAILVALFVVISRRTMIAHRDRWILAAPMIAAIVLMAYVVRVGGDFMHARMCLPPTFVSVMPALLLPARRISALALIGLVLWAGWGVVRRGSGRSYASAYTVEDERVGYTRWTKDPHPITSAIYIAAEGPVTTDVIDTATRDGRLLISEGGIHVPLAANREAPVAFVVGRLGVGGVVTPLDGIVIDTFGLANPLGARITPTNPIYPGHEKSLPWAWILADYADTSLDATGIAEASPEAIRAARHAMTCGPIPELLASVREPMTMKRFWENLSGSIARTQLEIPADPIEAERVLCR